MNERHPLPHKVLEAAAYWHVQLNDVDASPREHAAWEQWLAADASHRQAWARMQALTDQLNDLPAELALPTLSNATNQRRRLVKLLTVLVGVGAVGALLPPLESRLQLARADYRTRTGERRQVQLADGAILDINTDSAIDVHFTADLRLLRLWSGELLVQTATDPQLRPFEVHTEQGVIRALGTRFSVRTEHNQTRVAVLEHAVEIQLPNGIRQRVEAGQQTSFSANTIAPAQSVALGEGAWREGKLIAIDRRLDDFLLELERHRAGKIACAPSVAGLRLSGAFRLADTDEVLSNLVASLPIKLRYFTRYWVIVEAR